LGDSAASGEGNPDIPAHGIHPLGPSVAGWASGDGLRCDRSGRAASAQAAYAIQNNNPDTSVTFWHLACSGAAIVAPTPTGHDNPPCPLSITVSLTSCDGGLLTPYTGINKSNEPYQVLPPQVTQLERLIAASGRQPDVVLVTAGADDVNWSKVIKDCYLINKVPFHHKCETRYARYIAKGIQTLPSRFDQLSTALSRLVPPSSVYLTEYWDPTVDDRGGHLIGGHGFSWYCQADLLAPDAADRKWGHDAIVVPMNAAVDQAAARHGWQLIGGIGNQFRRHGLCATPGNRWIVSPIESLVNQGTLNGAYHANARGQSVIAGDIGDALARQFELSGS
jgi:hypothetical protein